MRQNRFLKYSIAILLLCAGVMLSGCRSADDAEIETPRFPVTQDPDAFISFLNQTPAVPATGAMSDIDNVADFPEAYYNTIDPDGTRTTLNDWRIANGFLNEDLSEAACDPSDCVEAHAKFRDTKDLGYGRNMFMRQNLSTGAVAVYVENFQVDVVPGVPYGPLNLEALVENDRTWNFGVNAIEFSAFPQSAADARPFTKFYNFAGEGKRAMLASGLQNHVVDLDGRGDKPMPTPCIVCHGGRGRTLVYIDSDGTKRLAPTITGGAPGDLQANMQTIEFNTLQFSDDAPGFTEDDNAEPIRLINNAILSTFQQRDTTLSGISKREGDWDPAFAIQIVNGRYGNNPGTTGSQYVRDFVPTNWSTGNATVYRSLVGPNCIVCHALRGSALNTSIQFSSSTAFQDYNERIDHLVFEKGLMPLGLLNYSNFWDSDFKDPGELAALLGHPERLVDGVRAIRPGSPVAVIASPPMAVGLNTSTNTFYDIPISGGDSAFASEWRWTVEPSNGATITAVNGGANDTGSGDAALLVIERGVYTVSLEVVGVDGVQVDSQSVSIIVQDEAFDALLPPAEKIAYYGEGGIDEMVRQEEGLGCTSCHSPGGGLAGIPLYYEPCSSDVVNGYEFVYKSVLARVNFDSPLSSLFLRKPTLGATDPQNREGSTIRGYHNGGYVLAADEDYSTVLTWILNGAPQGELPGDPIAATANCL